MSSAALQRRLPFADLGTGTPLLTVGALRSLFNRDEDAILYLIEDGQLPYAFDLAAPGARRMELRVWRGCLPQFRREGQTLAEALADILPPANFITIKSRTLAERWVCSRSHVHALLDARELIEVAAPDRRSTHSRNLTRASAEDFLRRRRAFARTTPGANA